MTTATSMTNTINMHPPDDPPGEPHSHRHRHEALTHSHAHYPDIHHRHEH